MRRLFAAWVYAAAAACAAAEAPDKLWDLKALSRVPKTYPAPAFAADGVRALFYEGEPYRGKGTRVFAWYGAPKAGGKKPGKVPAMVLVHGGGGTAFDEWVRVWVKRGYAAIAMDTCGAVPKRQPPPKKGAKPPAKQRRRGWQRHAHSGPPGWGGFANVDDPVRDQWTYHAVSAIVLAHSLIRSFDEVDAERTGLTGISWGGYLTCIAAGVDHRFRLAVPVYGCGFLGEDSCWLGAFAKMGRARAARWLALWDPSSHLGRARMPMLWVTGTNDFAYPFTSLQKSYRLAKGPRTLCVRVRMPHAHKCGWAPKEIYVFADSILKGAPGLARITRQGRRGRHVWAAYACDVPIVKAELNYTKDAGRWQKRKWQTAAARLDAKAKRATAELSEDAAVYYLNLIDERDYVVSTDHEVVKPSARWPMPEK